jgi:hypothetical protein
MPDRPDGRPAWRRVSAQVLQGTEGLRQVVPELLWVALELRPDVAEPDREDAVAPFPEGAAESSREVVAAQEDAEEEEST